VIARSFGLLLVSATLAAQADQSASSAQKPTYALQHGLSPGTSYGWALSTEAFLEQAGSVATAGGAAASGGAGSAGTETSHIRIVLHFALQIQAAKDGLLDAAHRVVRVEAKADTKLAKVQFDSAQTGSDPGAMKPLAALVGKTFVVTLDSKGRILKVHPPQELAAGAQEQLGVSDFDTLFSPWFLPLPEGAVAVGASWDANVKFLDPGFGGDGNCKLVQKLARVDGNLAYFERKLDVPKPQRKGMQLTVEQADGSAQFDRNTGRLVQSILEMKSKTTQPIGGGRSITTSSRVLVRADAEALPATATAAPATNPANAANGAAAEATGSPRK
jgi:hypothetical protein